MYHTTAVDEEGSGQSEYTVLPRKGLILIQGRGEGEAKRGHKLLRLRRGFAHIDRQHQESLLPPAFVGLLEEGHFLPAGEAPAGPKIEQHRLPAQIGKGDLAAIQAGQGEIGGAVAKPISKRAAVASSGSLAVSITCSWKRTGSAPR